MEYPKIDTLLERDSNFKVKLGALRRPEFAVPKVWHLTEKIDGTNIRVIIEFGGISVGMVAAGDIIPTLVEFRGRTDAADIPPFLVAKLYSLFPADICERAFADPQTGETPEFVILYGEGYGPRIQKGGGAYSEDVSFRLFDVLVRTEGTTDRPGRDWWLEWDSIEDIARKLNIKTVPVIQEAADLEEAIKLGLAEEMSLVAFEEKKQERTQLRNREGIVARTRPLLFDRAVRRLLWKFKVKDA